MFPVNIFRVNESSMELVRDSNGLCIPVKVGELGMIMGKVRNDVLSRFEGKIGWSWVEVDGQHKTKVNGPKMRGRSKNDVIGRFQRMLLQVG